MLGLYIEAIYFLVLGSKLSNKVNRARQESCYVHAAIHLMCKELHMSVICSVITGISTVGLAGFFTVK